MEEPDELQRCLKRGQLKFIKTSSGSGEIVPDLQFYSTNNIGVPGELTELEDSKFAPLTTEEPAFGPPALLLLGFKVEETAKIQLFLKEMGGEFLKVIHCTEDMIGCSLWESMHSEQPNLEDVKIAQSVPRVCFLSGLSGEEMMMFIDAYPEIGLEPAVFAALVPNSADKMLGEVIEEIMGDHEMMSAKQSE
ncbi:hypothetical protein QJS04_geneDACA002151 [Acorus gramineus]|uniref:Uncharacterized protein n=1 Tax=Acorus gramineus TaxID=55184 RepID=A0AAV9A9I0_ACOGR|nr:hypothetical protein QJS04_geneDACA002151 [Acorus gramineus]